MGVILSNTTRAKLLALPAKEVNMGTDDAGTRHIISFPIKRQNLQLWPLVTDSGETGLKVI